MNNLKESHSDMEGDDTTPFDPTDITQVLKKATDRGIRHHIMFEAMDIIRDNPTFTNEQAILEAFKKWNIQPL